LNHSPDRFSNAPISQLIGFEVQPGGVGEAQVDLNCGTHLHNPMQRVHGGAIAALADAAMGIAFGRTLLDNEDFSTIEMKVNFLRPVKDGVISAEANVVERGLRIGFVECTIRNARGKRVATATCTCTVISD
jgi:uncharacterized protein (TIGR00369 family)